MTSIIKSAALAALLFLFTSVSGRAQIVSEFYTCKSNCKSATVYQMGPEGDGICFVNICRRGRTGGHSAFSIVCDGAAEVHDITIRNVHWDNKNNPFIIKGYEDHIIRGIHFENCTIGGKTLNSTEDADFSIDKAEDIRFN